jgi:hypothetical protein
MQKYIGKIIDNNHADQDGRCQIFIEPLHHDLQKNQYPWFKMERDWTSNIPEIDDYVWCWFVEEEFHRQGYYGSNVTLKEYHDHLEYEDNVKATVGAEAEYPDVKFIKLKNGVSIAFSSGDSTPEITIHHPTAYVFIDKDGNISIDSNSNKIEMKDTGIVEISGDSGATLEKTLLGETLKGFLDQILDGIAALTVTVGAPGPSSTPINAATFTAIKTQLPTSLSNGVKTN